MPIGDGEGTLQPARSKEIVLPQRKTVKRAANPKSTREQILDATATCFQKFGASATTMEDIASTAGLGRKTLYRTFSSRAELIDALAIHHIDLFLDQIKNLVDHCATLEEAIVVGIVEILRQYRKDKVLMAAIEASSDHGVEHYLTDPDSPLLHIMQTVWGATFARARKTGELRSDMSDRDLSSWLLGVYLLLLLRSDMDADAQRHLLQELVMPGLRPTAAKRGRSRTR